MKKAATWSLPAMLVVLSVVRALPADVFQMPAGLKSLERHRNRRPHAERLSG